MAGAEREQREGASGKWVAHWKMVHIVRPVWEKAGAGQPAGPRLPAATYTPRTPTGLTLLEPAPRTVRGARDLLSVALQYGNAFGQGFQAAALKPADFFGNDDVLYLMEDMATGEIRLCILWEWLHKGAAFTEADAATGVRPGDPFTPELFERLLEEEYEKLRRAGNRDVHDDSKDTTLPIAARSSNLRPEPVQGALVHRPAEPQPEQPRPGAGAGAHRRVPRGLRSQGRHPHHPQSGLRSPRRGGRSLARVFLIQWAVSQGPWR